MSCPGRECEEPYSSGTALVDGVAYLVCIDAVGATNGLGSALGRCLLDGDFSVFCAAPRTHGTTDAYRVAAGPGSLSPSAVPLKGH